jgi:hypothetical protein
LNTYTDQQIENAIDLMDTVWGDQPDYIAMSDTAKELLALTVLRAHDLTKKTP